MSAALVTVGLAVASAGLETFGNVSNAKYQAQVARNNYNVAMQNAAAESTSAQIEQMRSDREYAEFAGEQQAAQAASGLDMLGRTQVLQRRSTINARGEAAQDIRLAGHQRIGERIDEAKGFRKEVKQRNKQAMIALASGVIKMGSEAQGMFDGQPGPQKSSLASSSRSSRRKFD